MSHVWAYHKRTGEKRRIPARWMLPNVFGANWALTPSTRGYKAAAPVEHTKPTSPEAAPDPAQPEPRKDK